MFLVHTLPNRNVIPRNKECNSYRHPKKLFAPFVNSRPKWFGNQDTTHLREFATNVLYLGWTENIKSKQLGDLIFVSIRANFE